MTGVSRRFRTIWRLTRVAIHLASGALIVWLVYPLISEQRRCAVKRSWSRQLLHIFGVDLNVSGTAIGPMRVANHVSWLDIFALNAASPAVFVAKDDVRRWPLIGWLSAQTGTIYIRRGSTRAAHNVVAELATMLSSGVEVVAFPEGTTSDGRQVLPFNGALLQGAIAAGVPIQPVALRYQTCEEMPAQAPVYCGDTSLLQSMWRVASTNGLTVQLNFLSLQRTTDCDRRGLASQLRGDIVAAMSEPWALVHPV